MAEKYILEIAGRKNPENKKKKPVKPIKTDTMTMEEENFLKNVKWS